MKRLFAALIAVPALLAALACAPTVASAMEQGDTTTPNELLTQLQVANPSSVAYSRDLFAEGIDADADGCNTRREVLQNESLAPVAIASGCDISAGEWFSWYEGATQTDPASLELDHLVALKEAWISGAYAWNNQQRSDYANDLDIDATLTVVTGSVNSAKGAYDPAHWLPSYEPSRCRYVTDWVAVKYRWNLTVDIDEKSVLQSQIDSYCAGTQMVVPPVRIDTVSATTPSGGVNPMPAGVHRLAGDDRFGTAAAISSRFNAGVPAVYIATGTNYPDALSASAVAGAEGVPLLLVLPDSIPAVVWAELQRLAPVKIIVVGGSTTVGEAVVSKLQTLAPVTRYAGVDRYETSRLIAEHGDLNSPTTYLATGTNFPDALSSAAAAGSMGAGVVLTYGPATSADDATKATLLNIGTASVRIAGSNASVSDGIAASLASIYPVTRYAGEDRFHTGALINQAAFSAPSTVFLALGTNFPDALAGGALAAALDAPLFIVRGDCIPEKVHSALTTWSPSTVVLLGSEASLSDNVASLTTCGSPPVDPGPAPTPPPGNPGDVRNCTDFSTWRAAQDWFEKYYPSYGDVAKLDFDNDLIACESLPGAP